MPCTLPLTWDEIRSELNDAYADRSRHGDRAKPVHVTIELDAGATLEVVAPCVGAFPGPRDLDGVRILIVRPLS